MSYVNTSEIADVLGIDEDGEEVWYNDLRAMFERMDKDGNGTIDFPEMELGIKASGIALDRRDVKKVFIRMDISGDGNLDIHEFFQNLETAWEKHIPDLEPQALFRQAIQKHLEKMEATLEKLAKVTLKFHQQDEDNSGELNFDEWAAGLKAVHCTSLGLEEQDMVFKKLDFEGQGELSIIEMMLEVAKFCLHYPDQLRIRDPEECFRQAMQILCEQAMGNFEEGEKWIPRPRIKRKKAITVPEVSPGDISDDEFADDGMSVEIQGSDGLSVNLTKTEARLSSYFYDIFKENKMDSKMEVDVGSEELKNVVKFLKRHQGKRPKSPTKPITTRDMVKLVEDPWDAVFIDRFDKKGVYDFILACYYTKVQSGVLLGCCKLATLKPVLKSTGTPSPEEVNEWIGLEVDQTQRRNR